MNEQTTTHTLAELETLAHTGPSPLLGWNINGDEIGWNDRGRDLIIHAEHPAVADEVDGVALALALQLRYRHGPDAVTLVDACPDPTDDRLAALAALEDAGLDTTGADTAPGTALAVLARLSDYPPARTPLHYPSHYLVVLDRWSLPTVFGRNDTYADAARLALETITNPGVPTDRRRVRCVFTAPGQMMPPPPETGAATLAGPPGPWSYAPAPEDVDVAGDPLAVTVFPATVSLAALADED